MAPDRKKQTYFNSDWLTNEEDRFNVWLQAGSNNISFRCKLCKSTKDLALGQGGIGSLKKHAGGETHQKNLELHKKMTNFFKPPTKPKKPTATNEVSQGSSSSTQVSTSSAKNATPIVRPTIYDQGESLLETN